MFPQPPEQVNPMARNQPETNPDILPMLKQAVAKLVQIADENGIDLLALVQEVSGSREATPPTMAPPAETPMM